MQCYDHRVSVAPKKHPRCVLVRCVVEEDEGDDSVRGTLCSVDRELGRAYRLQREENDHAYGGDDEERAAASTFNRERRNDGDCKVPDLQNAVDEELEKQECGKQSIMMDWEVLMPGL
jgi:hypothetical protein